MMYVRVDAADRPVSCLRRVLVYCLVAGSARVVVGSYFALRCLYSAPGGGGGGGGEQGEAGARGREEEGDVAREGTEKKRGLEEEKERRKRRKTGPQGLFGDLQGRREEARGSSSSQKSRETSSEQTVKQTGADVVVVVEEAGKKKNKARKTGRSEAAFEVVRHEGRKKEGHSDRGVEAEEEYLQTRREEEQKEDKCAGPQSSRQSYEEEKLPGNFLVLAPPASPLSPAPTPARRALLGHASRGRAEASLKKEEGRERRLSALKEDEDGREDKEAVVAEEEEKERQALLNFFNLHISLLQLERQ